MGGWDGDGGDRDENGEEIEMKGEGGGTGGNSVNRKLRLENM